jgi:(5-formylfuran-3-yl)methyl phosphate synthase
MRLLVSVSGPGEAATALAAGAQIIDAKDPAAGPLGAVSLDVLRAIVHRVGGARPVTAALGDASDEQDAERDAAAFTAAGTSLVKIGFAGTTDTHRIEALLAAADRGAPRRIVAVAYADYRRAGSAGPDAILAAAIRARAGGMLIDTFDKSGPGLFALMSADALRRIVDMARQGGLLAALAGRLTADDLLLVRRTGADIAGVRGAACDGGREGTVSADRIAHLLYRLRDEANSSAVTILGTMCGGTARAK